MLRVNYRRRFSHNLLQKNVNFRVFDFLQLKFSIPCSSSGGGGRRRQGWVLNEDGTWVRRRTSASSHSSETQYGGAGYDGYDGNRVNVGGGGGGRGGHEDGDVGHNTTG